MDWLIAGQRHCTNPLLYGINERHDLVGNHGPQHRVAKLLERIVNG
jgi:hypothetical protein